MKPKFIRINQACSLYSLSRSTWYRAFEAKELTRYKRGGSVLLEVDEIERWITGKTE